jgi:hypothetical protein
MGCGFVTCLLLANRIYRSEQTKRTAPFVNIESLIDFWDAVRWITGQRTCKDQFTWSALPRCFRRP